MTVVDRVGIYLFYTIIMPCTEAGNNEQHVAATFVEQCFLQ